MSLETQIDVLVTAITENTAALNAILAAGATPSNVVSITETPKQDKAPKLTKAEQKQLDEASARAQAKADAEKAAPKTEPVEETEVPTKVAAPAPKETEFSDPLDKDIVVVDPGTPEPAKIDVDAVIAECVETFKAKMVAADAERKAALKDAFPKLRSKWGLVGDAKLITLAPTPEKLVGLLEDIKAL